MDVVAQGSVSASSLLWERSASWVLTVVCKVMFDLVPGEARLRATPEPPSERDVPWEAPYARSLRVATDLVPIKPNVDVVLTGHAYAPGGRPTRSVVARLGVGSLDKSIEVVADRYFDPAGALHEGSPFTHMPLVYERAAGGQGTWNTAGVRVGQRDSHGNTLLPNLLVPGTQVLSRERLFLAPVGFGPIPADWPSRVEKLGRRSPRDLPPTWDGQSVPDDIGRDYFNVAPPDQQIATLREDETITLENLHASHPSLTCRLPGLRPKVMLEVRGAAAAIALRVDTLHIDTDRGTCTLVWRGHMPLRDRREVGRLVVALDAPAQPARQPTSAGSARASDPTTTVDSPLESTMQVSAQVASALLPFTASPPRSTPSRDALGHSSSSWGTAPARDPLSDSSSSWNAAPPPPRPSAQSSPSWSAVTVAPAATPSSQSSSSWSAAAPALEPARSPSPEVQSALPPPVPPPRTLAPSQPSYELPFSSAGGERSVSLGQDRVSYPALQPSAPEPVSWPQAPAPFHDSSSSSSHGLRAAHAPPAPFVASAPRQFVDSPWASGTPRESAAPSTVGAALIAASGAVATASLPPPDRGVLSTSNAAAGPVAVIPSSRIEPAPALRSAARSATRAEPREVLQILWFDPDTMPRIRRKAPWRTLLAALEDEGKVDADADDPGLALDPAEVEDRRDVFAILATAEIPEGDEVNEALAAGVRDDGRHVPALVLIAGELSFPFDELEALKATVSTVSPLVGTDENLKSTLDVAKEFLKTPELRSAPGVSDGLTTRIREAFAQGRRALAPGYLDTQTERVLLEQRHYQRRTLFGTQVIRALLSMPGASSLVPTYLPDTLSKKLPLFQRFKARLIVEVHLAVDQYETHSAALKVAALSRLASAPLSTRR